MVSDWPDGFVLSTLWTPETETKPASYRLTLENRTKTAISGFRLGISGPGRISEDAPITGGKLVHQLSNYAELAPEAGFVLKPGAEWTISIGKLDFALRHWTEGVATGFVITSENQTIPALTRPTELSGNSERKRRGTMRLESDAQVSTGIIPWPNSIAISGRRSTPAGLAPDADATEAEQAIGTFTEITALLFPGEALVRSTSQGGLPVMLDADSTFTGERYSLTIGAGGAHITAGTRTGFLYGLVTLGQMLRAAWREPQRFAFPADGRIVDEPAMGWRGCHLDVARRFYGEGEISRFLAILAWNKLNRFHWHLSDDEGFRVEIEAFPELVRHTAWRGYGWTIPPLFGTGPEKTGGFYSKAEVKRLVAQAARFGIEIVPEIDVPGHCYALLEALPQLKDAGENGKYFSIQSFPNNCLNPAVEAVYPVIETIFDELIELFPSRYFHVGADEVPADAWSDSPQAEAMRKKLGVTGTAPLQAQFLKRIQAHLSKRGRITGAWEEAAHGGGIDRALCYLVGWRDVEASQKLAAEGYDVVVAPGQAYYLDMANGPEWHEPGSGWAGWSSPQKAYEFDPTAGWSGAERGRFLGVQACIWSEPMGDRAVFDRLVFPRLSAIAETGWTQTALKDFARFSALAGLMPNLYGHRE